MPLIAINRHWFFSLNALDKYIDSLPYGKQQFSAKQQGLKFYAIYVNTIIENKSAFAKKMKDRGSWRAFGYSKRDLNKLTKLIQDHNVAHKWTKDYCKIVIKTIEEKWEKTIADYIKGYNTIEKYAKAIWKAAN